MKTKEVKVLELSGYALDWAVSQCEGYTPDHYMHSADIRKNVNGDVIGITVPNTKERCYEWFRASTDWTQGGPIIEREEILFSGRKGAYLAWLSNRTKINFEYTPETHLIAAMRCYVASKLGDVVPVPVELLEV